MRFALWRLAACNLLRKPGRSVAAVLGVLLAAGTTFVGGLISMGVNHALGVGMARLGADLMVVPRGAVQATHTALVMGELVAFYMDGGVTDRVRAIAGVKQASPQVYVQTLASSACCTGRLFLVGFDPETDFTVQPWLNRALGRGLAPDEIVAGNHVLMVPGEPLKLYGTEYRVVDRLDPTGMGIDETVFLPMETVSRMAENSKVLAEQPLEIPPGSVSAVMVSIANAKDSGKVAQEIEATIPEVSALTTGQVTQGVTRDLAGLMAWLVPISGGVFLVSLMLLLVLFSAVTAERSREIGLMRAMGATAGQAVFSLVLEALLLGVMGGWLGVAAGLGIYGLFQTTILFSYALPFLWPSVLQQAVFGGAVVLVAGGLAGLSAALPAWRIAQQEPHLAIYGGKT